MKTVLLVDDEPEMASLVQMTLTDLEVRVLQAANPSEALEVARTEQPNLVLLDIALGAHNGLAFLPRLKEESALATTPIVMFSVHDSQRAKALEAGADGFVAKPFRAADLRRVIESHLK